MYPRARARQGIRTLISWSLACLCPVFECAVCIHFELFSSYKIVFIYITCMFCFIWLSLARSHALSYSPSLPFSSRAWCTFADYHAKFNAFIQFKNLFILWIIIVVVVVFAYVITTILLFGVWVHTVYPRHLRFFLSLSIWPHAVRAISSIATVVVLVSR